MNKLIPLFLALLLASCSSNKEVAYQNFRASQKSYPTPVGGLAYQDQGTGTPIILIHGVPTSSWKYRKVIPGLTEEHRVIAVDLIGYGSSAKPKGNSPAYQPAEQARQIRNLAKSLGLKSYSLMFHDMGGLVAWEMLRQEPAAISNLIVLNTIVRKDGFNAPEFKPNTMTSTLSKVMASPLTNNVVLGIIFQSLGVGSHHGLNSSECFGYVTPLREGSHDALYQFYTSLTPALYSRLETNKSVFRNFKGRTLILWGAKDEVLTPKQIPFLTEHLRVPSQNIHVYPKNHHFLAEEIPEEVVQKVNHFLSSGLTHSTSSLK